VNPKRPFHDEPRSVIVRRRLVTVPRSIGLLVLLTLLAPLLAVVAVAVDLARSLFGRPWMAVRFLAFAWVFLAAELVGLVWFLASWVTSGFGLSHRRLVARAWAVQRWWGRTLLAVVQRLFSLELEVEGDETITPGPILAMFRHASIVDNLLPLVLIQDRHGLELRWLIKRELLSLPALDVGGTRLPNHFVARASGDARTELRAIRRLAADLGEQEGVLIYPEGTRFTPERRTRALDQLRTRSPELHERASRLQHVLPPRLGGPLVLLEAGYDVVVCAHVGLDGFAKIGDMWSGAIVGRTIRVRFWRTPAAEIPKDRNQRIDWLFDQWERVDAWVAAASVQVTPTPRSRRRAPSPPG
jgi:1-acyl-sn-glycerol-3-phosphate acyltransferase